MFRYIHLAKADGKRTALKAAGIEVPPERAERLNLDAAEMRPLSTLPPLNPPPGVPMAPRPLPLEAMAAVKKVLELDPDTIEALEKISQALAGAKATGKRGLTLRIGFEEGGQADFGAITSGSCASSQSGA